MNQDQYQARVESIEDFEAEAQSILLQGGNSKGEDCLRRAVELVGEYKKYLGSELSQRAKIKEALNTAKMLKTQLIGLDQ